MDIVLPVKIFSSGKQRLAKVLSPSERYELCRMMSTSVLAELSKLKSINRVLVVSTEPEIKAMAKRHSFDVLDMAVVPRGLNFDVDYALQKIGRQGAADACVVHSDLPLLTSAALSEVLDAHAQGPERKMTLVSDHARKGTNVRLCRPVDAVASRYGHFSLIRHTRAAVALEVKVERHASMRLERDLDEESDILPIVDLVEQLDLSPPSPTIEFLKSVARRMRCAGVAHECF